MFVASLYIYIYMLRFCQKWLQDEPWPKDEDQGKTLQYMVTKIREIAGRKHKPRDESIERLVAAYLIQQEAEQDSAALAAMEASSANAAKPAETTATVPTEDLEVLVWKFEFATLILYVYKHCQQNFVHINCFEVPATQGDIRAPKRRRIVIEKPELDIRAPIEAMSSNAHLHYLFWWVLLVEHWAGNFACLGHFEAMETLPTDLAAVCQAMQAEALPNM